MKNIKKVLLVIGGLIVLVIILISILPSTHKTEEEKTEITKNETIVAPTEPAISSAGNKVVSESSEVKTTKSTPTPATTQSDFQFYTSSYGTAKYYYPASCSGWKSLSPQYLKGFYTLDDLLKAYLRTENPSC